MVRENSTNRQRAGLVRFVVAAFAGLVLLVCLGAALSQPTAAITKIPNPDPKPGSFGLEATKKQPPPTQGARISSPSGGQSFTESPITVSGICPDELLIEIYNNGVMVGAVPCKDGKFSLKISLFVGENELQAVVYDSTDQAGPKSNVVKVTYRNTNFASFGENVTLTSPYGRRGVALKNRLEWPLQLSGGSGPYALSIDWGDGSEADLRSLASGGGFNIDHAYQRAGTYIVNVKVTDKNGVSAFLQVVAVVNGTIDTQIQGDQDENVCRDQGGVKIIWIPAVLALLMLPIAYWLGRRSQLVSMRNKMEKERDQYLNQKDS